MFCGFVGGGKHARFYVDVSDLMSAASVSRRTGQKCGSERAARCLPNDLCTHLGKIAFILFDI